MKAIICMLALAASGPAAAANATFKDWTVVCDNTRVCAAFGLPAELDEMGSFLKLERAAEPQAGPNIELSVATSAAVWRVEVDGVTPPGLEAVQASVEETFGQARLDEAKSRALTAAIGTGSTLQIRAGEAVVATLSLAGSSAALRWMDEQQKRAGTLTALVAKGPNPVSAVPAPPLAPLVRAAKPASQAGLPTELPAAVKARLGDCDPDIGRLGAAPTTSRLAPGLLLHQVPCSAGAYNEIDAFFLTDERGGNVRDAPIRYPGSNEVVSQLMNADFDPAQLTLSNFEKGRGIADCGAANHWLWDGEAFTPTYQLWMGECRGVRAESWPVAFRSRPE